MKQRLGIITDVVVLLVALFVGSVVVKNVFFTRAAPPPTSLKPGDDLSHFKEINWARSDRTLLIAVRKGCKFCEDSMPFYARLSQMKAVGGTKARLIVVLPDDANAAEQLLHSNGVELPYRAGIPLKLVKAQATPTLILADRGGKVIQSWEGMLSPRKEQEVAAALANP